MPKKSKDIQTESANGARSRVKKTARKKPIAKKAPSRKSKATKPFQPSDEQIRLRAYFLAEKRAQLSLKGDHNSDWLEAKRQLFEEAGIPVS